MLLAGAGVVTPAPATAAGSAQSGCAQLPTPADPIPELPWPQQWFAPERAWPLSQGDGVVVAVVDTGVDAGHPQLRDGRVLTGTDLLSEPEGAHVDCMSHGTAVASIVAAAQVAGIGFVGLAPRAEILPIRVAEQDSGTESGSEIPPDRFAEAIRWAADHDADVVNLSIVFYQDHPEIAAAVDHARGEGVVVVAAVGPPPQEAGVDLTPYPAAYPGVIGVGGFGLDDQRTPVLTSYLGPEVDLLAPGEAVTGAAAGGGHLSLQGSSFAAPFVSGAAALLLAADPDQPASAVERRLLAAADPGPGTPDGTSPPIVNPYRALTERLVELSPEAVATPLGDPAVDPAAAARAQRWQRAGQLGVLVAIVAAVVFGLAAGGRAVWRRGARRGWRLIPAPAQPVPPPADEMRTAEPERTFFTVPTTRDRRAERP